MTASPPAMHDSFTLPNPPRPDHQAPIQFQAPLAQLQQAGGQPNKRQRPNTTEDLNVEEDFDSKDPNKAKPARACARCKGLKVRCEAKTENEPCKRCLNGGHECFIPGRKIRRVPPKREHLINQIQSQAKEIERLMQQLESAGAGKSDHEGSESHQTSPSSPYSPTGNDSYLSPHSSSAPRTNPATNKAIEDWIAKTRENMQELSYICVGDAGAPESYVVKDNPEEGSDSSGDDQFVDVQEELDGYEGEEEYRVAVQDPDGAKLTSPSSSIRHKVSSSSMGTTKSGNRKKYVADDKPANLPVEASPFGLFGNLSLKSRPKSRNPSEVDEEEEKGSGIANLNFFTIKPSEGPAVGRQVPDIQHQAPAILARGLITPAEAESLFQIYYAEMNLSVSLLDPILYDAKRTFWRSPFLFTVVCAIASRYYVQRPELYAQAMQYAQTAAGNALISGTKNVEMCAAYILLSLYPMPVKRWAQQRSWLYLGLAIRIATDLNLHLPNTAKPKNENHAREMLNRTRIWLNCFNLDRSTGSQYGKPPTISNTDYTANHSDTWWNASPHNLDHFDVHLCAYNAELKLMSTFVGKIYNNPEHPTGLNKDVDFESLATQTDDDLQRLKAKWFAILDKTDMTDPENCFRTGLLRIAYSYGRLIALSYGFQHAFGKNDGQDENPFLMRCLSAATDVVNAAVRDIPRSMRHYFRHGPEAQSVFVTFASAFLVKLLQPKFASYLSQDQRIEIHNLVQQVIDLLAEVALDDRHGPKLYSRFLKGLLAKPLAKLDPSDPDAPLTPAARPRRRPKAPAHDSMDSIESTGSAPGLVFNHPSPATSSPSPPPAESIASFDNFRPAAGIDPYAPDDAAVYVMNPGGEVYGDLSMSTDFFKPELPFDEEIVRSFQDLTNPSEWQDISMPEGYNWMSQFQTFQQNMGLDLQAQVAPSQNNQHNMYDPSLQFLTGAAR